MTTPVLTGVAYAYANHGRWVADCPRPYCTSAMALLREQETFVCEGAVDSCGITSPIQWPNDPAAVELILMQRPAFATRNWVLGETLEDLIRENAEHGIAPPSDGQGTTLAAFIVDERLVGGTLHEQLAAAAARQRIGA